jgi:integrase
MGGPFGKICQCLITTGLRRTECALIQVSWISFQTKTLTVPSNVSKNDKALQLPLGEFSMRILRSAVEEHPSGLLFGTPAGIIFNSWSQAKAALDKASGVYEWKLHDLRRTYRSNLGRIGVTPHIAERLVNHVSAQSEMSRIYDRYSYADEMIAAVHKYDQFFREKILMVHGG